MMEQLGIKALRPGPSGNPQAPNSANYDEALANPFPKLAAALVTFRPFRSVKAIVDTCRRKAPQATIVLTGILPRNGSMSVMPEIRRINENLARFADGRTVRYVDLAGRLADGNGRLLDGMMNRDGLHPSVPGYQVWADALKPLLAELLGPPAAVDLAPPPTGDPSARGPIRVSCRPCLVPVATRFAS